VQKVQAMQTSLKVAFRYSLQVLNIYSARNACYKLCTRSEYRNAPHIFQWSKRPNCPK